MSPSVPILPVSFAILSAIFLNWSLLGEESVLRLRTVGRAESPVLVEGDVFGQREFILIDTGAAYSFVDLKFKDRLGAQVDSKISSTADQKFVTAIYRATPFKIGDTEAGGDLMCLDLQSLRYVTGIRLTGGIGVSFLKERILMIDHDKSEVELVHPGSEWRIGDRKDYVVYPLTETRGCPSIELGLGSETVTASIDTGSDSELFLPEDAFTNLEKSGDLKVLGDTNSATVKGIREFRYGVLSELDFGNQRIREVGVHEVPKGRGMIGMGLLARFHLILDFPAGKMYLKPHDNYRGTISLRDVFGAAIGYRPEGFGEVAQLIDDSPVKRAGLKLGDYVWRIGDLEGESLNKFGLIRLCEEKAGKTINMVVERNGEKKTLSVTLGKRPKDSLK